jgi:hypothetical protein
VAASGPVPFDNGRPDAAWLAARARVRLDRGRPPAAWFASRPRWGGPRTPVPATGQRFGDIGAIGRVRALDAPGQSAPVGIAVSNSVIPRAVYQTRSTRFAAFPPQALPGGLAQPAPPVVPFRELSADVRQVRRRTGG